MTNENAEKLKLYLAAMLVAHEKMVNHEILVTMQIPVDFIREKFPGEIKQYKSLLDDEYGIGAPEFVHCKECVYRGSENCICHPFYPTDDFYCARGEEKFE